MTAFFSAFEREAYQDSIDSNILKFTFNAVMISYGMR